MGKIRINVVKRTARKLLNMYPDLFIRDFEHNKKVVNELIEVRSKKLRNQIAGYITHLKKVEERRQKIELEER
ncbi:30S ribosomal protein S17 [Ignicoccus islandicus DSM 13165]|uniref:Small ribosomal subunit protein eS17 n=1 Tax=Ignicoccus islandicus DSM 13165 TaxID=940295 RepID=A0A0U2M9M5_9CREN|nr:30S ribosomal protein S17e [Ignicoccus islandicus]ALU11741.1 30S ribosomal protein S17 [Ignicoccus islandicus DSM 13165]